jgi:hypothetical protein
MNDPTPAYLDGDHLPETLARLDELIDRTENIERLRSGLGMRLALTMAQELREKRDLGELSGALVAGWVERHGQDSVDMAVAIAREFLLRPDQLAKEFAERLQRVAVDSSPPPLSGGEAEPERGGGIDLDLETRGGGVRTS